MKLRFMISFMLSIVSCLSFSFAYTPTSSDEAILDKFIERIDTLAEDRWPGFTQGLLPALQALHTKVQEKPRVAYIFEQLILHIDPSSSVSTEEEEEEVGESCQKIMDFNDPTKRATSVEISSAGRVFVSLGESRACNGCQWPECDCVDGYTFVYGVALELYDQDKKTLLFEVTHADADQIYFNWFIGDTWHYSYKKDGSYFLATQDRVFGPYEHPVRQVYSDKDKTIWFFIWRNNDQERLINLNTLSSSDPYDYILRVAISDDGSHVLFDGFNGTRPNEMWAEPIGDHTIILNNQTIGNAKNIEEDFGFCRETNIPYYFSRSEAGEQMHYREWTSPLYTRINRYEFDNNCDAPYWVGMREIDGISYNYLYHGDTLIFDYPDNIGNVKLADNGDLYFKVFKGFDSGYKLYKNNKEIESRWRVYNYEPLIGGDYIVATSISKSQIIVNKNGEDIYNTADHNSSTGPHVDFFRISPDKQRRAMAARGQVSTFIVDGEELYQGGQLRGFAFSPDSKHYVTIKSLPSMDNKRGVISDGNIIAAYDVAFVEVDAKGNAHILGQNNNEAELLYCDW